MKLKIKKLDHGRDLPLPKYMTSHSVGMDLYAAVRDDIVVGAKEIEIVPTGIAIELEAGYEAQIRPRSGLAAKYGIGILNSPGTIDSDYRGEIKIILFNFSNEDFRIKRGMRIAQMVINKVEIAQLEEVDRLTDTDRGSGGFGHTGI